MSTQREAELQTNGAAPTIGSRRRSLVRLTLLAVTGLVVLVAHYLFLFKLFPNRPVVIVLVIGTWIAVIFRLHRSIGPWLDFIFKDSAYGEATEHGIKYRYMLRANFMPWSSVARIEYSPRNGGRINAFRAGKFSFSRERPIQFGPSPYNSGAVEGIGKILGQQGTLEKLVTTDSVPERVFHL